MFYYLVKKNTSLSPTPRKAIGYMVLEQRFFSGTSTMKSQLFGLISRCLPTPYLSDGTNA